MANILLLGGTKGLGFQLAKAAMESGHRSIVYGRTHDDAVCDLIPAPDRYFIDLTDRDSVTSATLPDAPIDYLFWVAGRFLKAPLVDVAASDIDRMIDLHLRGPVHFLQRFLKQQRQKIHLVTIASCSAWRRREDEALYCSLKAAQAAFSRNICAELVRDRAGSRVTVINPGGLNIPTFWEDFDQPLDGFLDPTVVARHIWDHLNHQQDPFLELQILRQKPVVPGAPPVIYAGPETPEIPVLP